MNMPPASLVDPAQCLPLRAAAPRGAGTRRASASTVQWLKRMLRMIGPGYVIAVGYMDPGNWATSVAGGSAYGYELLWIVLVSSVLAMFLQVLCVRLGLVTGMDLAQACRAHSSRASATVQWIACEIAICACDLAEVIGTAIALKLLFGVPLPWGVAMTVLDVFIILWMQQRPGRRLEALIVSLLGIVASCFLVTLALAKPDWQEVVAGLVPRPETVTDPGMLYLSLGIIGATVMPHNLYLHSSIVQGRCAETGADRRSAISFGTADTVLALTFAFFVNAAILVASSAVFHRHGLLEVAQLQDAYKLLGPLTGTAIASSLFAVALLASGMSSAVTATLAGQIVMEGYVRLRLNPGLRRILTRGLAVIPALSVTIVLGDSGVGKLLLASQVVLGLQLPLAVIPLIRFTSSRQLMGPYANSPWVARVAMLLACALVGLNILLAWQALRA